MGVENGVFPFVKIGSRSAGNAVFGDAPVAGHAEPMKDK